MKSYDEIANRIFERRDKYIAMQKKKKRIVISIVAPAVCCCFVLIAGLGLWKGGFFNHNIPVSNSSQNASDNNSSKNNNQNSSSDINSSHNSSSSSESSEKETSSQNKVIPNSSTPSSSSEQSYNNTPSDSASSTPPVTETNYFIDSIDKINFYSAKKIISDKSLFPFGMSADAFTAPNALLLNNTYAEYPIDRNKVFTATMVTYFTIELNDEKGFLAQKLGGTGLVEVVITKNNIDDLEEMITFKREEKYYTCLRNGGGYDTDTNITNSEFSSHKYIEGFNIVKNKLQYNFKFTVYYEGSKVIGFECAPFGNTSFEYKTDDVTFIEDFCVVLYTKQTFTIDELEVFFKNQNEGESL